MPFPPALRVCLVVTITVMAFALGFVFWSTLFGLLFASIATSGTLLALAAHLVSRFKKRPNEFGDTFAALAFTGLMLLAGWWIRYHGNSEGYTIVRGEFIDGYIYSSKEAVWRHSKI